DELEYWRIGARVASAVARVAGGVSRMMPRGSSAHALQNWTERGKKAPRRGCLYESSSISRRRHAASLLDERDRNAHHRLTPLWGRQARAPRPTLDAVDNRSWQVTAT